MSSEPIVAEQTGRRIPDCDTEAFVSELQCHLNAQKELAYGDDLSLQDLSVASQSTSAADDQEEEINILQANKNVWSLAEMKRILNGLSDFEAFSTSPERSYEPIHKFIGYFSVIENARLECLLGDYTYSLHIVDSKKILDRSELLVSVPTCHANASYHAGICMLMSRKYASVVDVLGDIILQISRQLKPGAAIM